MMELRKLTDDNNNFIVTNNLHNLKLFWLGFIQFALKQTEKRKHNYIALN